jgi:hypothetical protein
LNLQHASDPSLPDFASVLMALGQASWYADRQDAMPGAIQRLTADQFLNRLLSLATDAKADTQVRAQAFLAIRDLAQWLDRQSPLRLDPDWTAFYALASHAIAAMLDDPARVAPVQAPPVPPGSPIGN